PRVDFAQTLIASEIRSGSSRGPQRDGSDLRSAGVFRRERVERRGFHHRLEAQLHPKNLDFEGSASGTEVADRFLAQTLRPENDPFDPAVAQNLAGARN